MYTISFSQAQAFKVFLALISITSLSLAIDACASRQLDLKDGVKEEQQRTKLFVVNNDQCKRICERFRNYLEVALPKEGINYSSEISEVHWVEIQNKLWEIILDARSEISALSEEGIMLANLSRERYPYSRFERDFNNFRFKFSNGDYTLEEMIAAGMQYIQQIQFDLQGEMLKNI